MVTLTGKKAAVKETRSTIWLYLARRDKKAVRVLAKAQGRPVHANRVENLDSIGLPPDWSIKIKQTVYDNRMLWELWVESCDDYEKLRAALTSRGYSNVPASTQPEMRISRMEVPILNMNSIPKAKTMMKKRNHS